MDQTSLADPYPNLAFAANSMLGRPYRAVGQIMSGDSIGKEIGFPTFNLDWCPELQMEALFPSFVHSMLPLLNGCRPTVTGGQADPVLKFNPWKPRRLHRGCLSSPYQTGAKV